MAREETVHQLGCGTLIVIALIVVFLGNQGMNEIGTEIQGVNRQIERLENKIESLEDSVTKLERAVKALTEEVRKR